MNAIDWTGRIDTGFAALFLVDGRASSSLRGSCSRVSIHTAAQSITLEIAGYAIPRRSFAPAATIERLRHAAGTSELVPVDSGR